MPKRPDLRKIMVIGSGPIVIGQAAEFDYAGTQACRALKEEGLEVVLVNSNPATIMTDANIADRVYVEPLLPEYLEEIIAKERPDGLLATLGGQVGLNLAVKMAERGTLEKYNVELLGTPLEAIKKAEDRELFKLTMQEINQPIPESDIVETVEAAREFARKVGYPLIVRPAYTLGGTGGGIVNSEEELNDVVNRGLTHSMISQVLIERSVAGWKEVEYEVIRDASNNCITVCNMENIDPMGIHTGESIVIAPSQTLTNAEYHGLREISLRAVRHLGIVGECNIQFALNPANGDYRIIEVNARLSRSSALASKATGYPLAFVAAKLIMGHTLPGLRNSITRATTACFEPALDYLVVKIPRWDLKKFGRVSKKLGSEMKSVGEVMAIGRNVEEAIQKAARMLQIGVYGLVANKNYSFANLQNELQNPTDERLFGIAEAFRKGWSVARIHELTRIDGWFLRKIRNVVEIESRLRQLAPGELPADLLREAKQKGFSDKQIAILIRSNEEEVRAARKAAGIVPCVKQIDTLAAEYPARTNYLYLTYNGTQDDVSYESAKRKVIVLGSGSYSIGSSVEFDWCCVNAAQSLKKRDFATIMINYNPETVSTDYDICDRLYFDELSYERVLDIYERENPEGVVLSMGGQIPNNIAMKCGAAGVRVLGTSPENIDRAENRFKFSLLLDELGVDQPEWKELRSTDEAKAFSKSIGYPVLIRPSYVLSGAAMSIVFKDKDLDTYLTKASMVSPKYPVVISKFIMNAKEIEMDAVADRGAVIASAIVEHVENAGVHSGDATMVLPPQKLYIATIRRIREIGTRIAKALDITGPFNIQFIAKDNSIKVIECNLRASRSFPFVSKVAKTNFIDLAVRAMTGAPVRNTKSTLDLNYVGVKAPQFSFQRLKGADPVLGVEMASTGEVACLGEDVHEAFLKAILSTGFTLPEKNILLSIGGEGSKIRFLESARKLHDMKFTLFATDKTSEFLRTNGIANTKLHKVHENKEPNIRDYLARRKIDFVISIPNPGKKREFDSLYRMRRMAVDYSIPLMTNLQVSELLVQALAAKKNEDLKIKAWNDYE